MNSVKTKEEEARRKFLERRRKTTAAWYKRNKEKRKEYDAKCRANLTDGYILQALYQKTNIPKKDIPHELIIAERILIEAKRNFDNSIIEGHKYCKYGDHAVSISDFYKRSNGWLRPYCIACYSKIAKLKWKELKNEEHRHNS